MQDGQGQRLSGRTFCGIFLFLLLLLCTFGPRDWVLDLVVGGIAFLGIYGPLALGEFISRDSKDQLGTTDEVHPRLSDSDSESR